MTTPMFAQVADLRTYMEFNGNATSKYADDALGSNLRAASSFLERRTGRWFQDRTGVTYTTTSQGAASVSIPGFRTFTSVTLAGAGLTADTSFWATPDAQNSGVFIAIQLRSYNTGRPDWYKAIPEWFDRNLDSPRWLAGGYTSLPNDLVVTGDAGYVDANIPEELRLATKALAGFWTKRPDALLSGGVQTPDGSIFDYSRLPIEVQSFISDWRIGPQATLI